ncbi:UNVERIFIED_ORG: hypothetical protein M2328_005587 [Rhodococcus erythropolis]
MGRKKLFGNELRQRYENELAEANEGLPEPYYFSPAELAALDLIQKHGNTMTRLEAAIAAHGYATVSDSGRVTINPAVSELRLTAGALAPLLSRVDPDAEDEPDDTPGSRSAAARTIARARWDSGSKPRR